MGHKILFSDVPDEVEEFGSKTDLRSVVLPLQGWLGLSWQRKIDRYSFATTTVGKGLIFMKIDSRTWSHRVFLCSTLSKSRPSRTRTWAQPEGALSVDLLDGRYHSAVRMLFDTYEAHGGKRFEYDFIWVCVMGLSKKLWETLRKIISKVIPCFLLQFLDTWKEVQEGRITTIFWHRTAEVTWYDHLDGVCLTI